MMDFSYPFMIYKLSQVSKNTLTKEIGFPLNLEATFYSHIYDDKAYFRYL
jgi:hypothetical protein